jgi:hypothetical protein
MLRNHHCCCDRQCVYELMQALLVAAVSLQPQVHVLASSLVSHATVMFVTQASRIYHPAQMLTLERFDDSPTPDANRSYFNRCKTVENR